MIEESDRENLLSAYPILSSQNTCKIKFFPTFILLINSVLFISNLLFLSNTLNMSISRILFSPKYLASLIIDSSNVDLGNLFGLILIVFMTVGSIGRLILRPTWPLIELS
ncbi:hypothetical protein BpHYR1_012975 [Brachionus plicatilis]|uniref:Uncharacterized protein n=1 Tax=Brachionus plicatilis TaxID=10195 RepID=A0A3M7P8P9_BRAPC|nr:hypothetical protein BpHYR1_012975 [Brachionus plicatilis]